MGVFAIGVKTPPAPAACGYDSIAEAIANPLSTDDYNFTLDLQADAGKYGAAKYNTNGSSGGFTVNFSAINNFEPGAAMTIYTVTEGGSIVDTVVHGDGEINPGDVQIEVPDPAPFFVVVQNVGGTQCDYFEITFFAAS